MFFAFNSTTLTSDQCIGTTCTPNISASARLDHQFAWLAKYPNANVLVAGNTDERGTETYNLILGQRRADAVRNYLMARGVAPGRILTISYGKDRPLNGAHDEAGWHENRNAITSVSGFIVQYPP